MVQELAYSTTRRVRLVEDNFWFRVERKVFRGWSVDYRSRDRDAAVESFKWVAVQETVE